MAQLLGRDGQKYFNTDSHGRLHLFVVEHRRQPEDTELGALINLYGQTSKDSSRRIFGKPKEPKFEPVQELGQRLKYFSGTAARQPKKYESTQPLGSDARQGIWGSARFKQFGRTVSAAQRIAREMLRGAVPRRTFWHRASNPGGRQKNLHAATPLPEKVYT